MEKLHIWAKEIQNKIATEKQNIFPRDYKFYKLDLLENLAFHIDNYSDECAECQKLKPKMEQITDRLAAQINGTPAERAAYEKEREKIVTHMQRVHKLAAREYYASLYAFVGMAAGSLLAGGIAYFALPEYLKFAAISGFVVGLIAGRIAGKRKDNKVIQENRAL